MIKRIRSSLAYRFVFFVLLFVVISMLAVSLLLSLFSYDEFKYTTRRDYRHILRSSAGEIRLYMQEAQNALETLAYIVTYLKPSPGAWEKDIALTAFNHKNIRFTDVALISTKTGHVITTNPARARPAYGSAPVYQEALQGKVAVSAVQHTAYNMPYVQIAVPIKRLGRIDEILWGELNLKSVWDVLDGIKIGESGYVSVLGARGHYISHLEIKPVLKKVAHEKTGSLKKIRHTDEIIDWIDEKSGEFCLAAHISELDWYILLSQPVQELFLHLSRSVVWIVAVILGCCLAVSLFGRRFVVRLLEPIHELHRQVQVISSGDLDQRVVVDSRDEIGALASSFNGMAASLKDMIDGKVQAEKEAARARHMAILGDASGKVTHEINNFVNNVKSFLRVLNRKPMDDQTQRFMESLQTDIAHVSAFSTDFLSFARKPECMYTLTSPAAVIEDALASLLEAVRRQGITVKYRWGDSLPKVPLDITGMHRVVTNLVKNSMDALARKEGRKRVTISGYPINGSFCLSIGDNGEGIPPVSREKIFEPFFSTKGKDGTGLGLAIIKDIVDAHGGRIECLCPPEGGTEFRLYFPMVPPGVERPASRVEG